MFDDDNDGEGRQNDSAGGYSSLVAQTRRTLAVSYALEERLRATGHLRGYAAAGERDVVHSQPQRVPTPKPLAVAA